MGTGERERERDNKFDEEMRLKKLNFGSCKIFFLKMWATEGKKEQGGLIERATRMATKNKKKNLFKIKSRFLLFDKFHSRSFCTVTCDDDGPANIIRASVYPESIRILIRERERKKERYKIVVVAFSCVFVQYVFKTCESTRRKCTTHTHADETNYEIFNLCKVISDQLNKK